MSHDGNSKLIYMANQIGTFFHSQGEATAVTGTAEHIKKFWDPRMLKKIYAHVEHGGEGLHPWVKTAIESLMKKAVA